MTQKFYKKVLMPIEVAEGNYCWGREENEKHTRCCGHFDNEGGHPTCKFELDDYSYLAYDKYGYVPKPKRCLGLTEKASGEKVHSRNLTRTYNRLLKNALKQAAQLVDATCKKEKKNDRSRNNV